MNIRYAKPNTWCVCDSCYLLSCVDKGILKPFVDFCFPSWPFEYELKSFELKRSFYMLNTTYKATNSYLKAFHIYPNSSILQLYDISTLRPGPGHQVYKLQLVTLLRESRSQKDLTQLEYKEINIPISGYS